MRLSACHIVIKDTRVLSGKQKHVCLAFFKVERSEKTLDFSRVKQNKDFFLKSELTEKMYIGSFSQGQCVFFLPCAKLELICNVVTVVGRL